MSAATRSADLNLVRLPLVGALPRARVAEACWALGAMALSAVLAVWVLRLWEADLYRPFVNPEDDTGAVLSVVQGMLRHGWILVNPDLGAPAGQQLYDDPTWAGNTIHHLLMMPMGLFTSDAAPVVNIYFLAAFPLCALSAFALMRWMRISAPVAFVCATLFAVAPYHFIRFEWHLFLGAYFTVPIAAYLILAVYADAPLFDRRQSATGLLRWASARTGLTLAACVVVGLSDLHYAAFTILLVAVAGLVTFIARRGRRALAAAGAVVAALVVTVIAELSPNLIYELEHGANPAVVDREPEESFKYSTNLANLVFPVRDHRLEPLDRLDDRYTSTTPVGVETTDRIGLVAVVGLGSLLVMLLALPLGEGRIGRDPRRRQLAVAAATALAIGTTGGVSAILAYVISPQLRSWNRLSVFIMLFALLAVALLLDALRARIRNRVLAGGVLAAMLAIGVLDQTSPTMAPDHAFQAAQWESDDAFVSEIEERLGSGAMVLQLPYVPYPEAEPIHRMNSYSHFRGYLHSDSLRWSFGAMRGRDEDWLAPHAGSPIPALAQRAAAAGFDGVWVDRYGYADEGAATERKLERALGERPLVSPDQRLSFFELHPQVQRPVDG